MENVKILPKGQITIPVEIRKKLNIKEGDIVSLENTPDGIIMKKGITLFDVAGSLKLKKDISNEELIKDARNRIRNEHV
jgi:AbrB family looped-hinge helix DNA binding protein